MFRVLIMANFTFYMKCQKFSVLHVQLNTTIFHLVQWEYNYMFRPNRWAIFWL